VTTQDIRWIQRFNHIIDALACLKEAVALPEKRQLSHLEQLGLIQIFEFTHNWPGTHSGISWGNGEK